MNIDMDMLSQISNKNAARVNELKGNLIEYLTAWHIAEAWRTQADFHASIDDRYFDLLHRYEREIKLLDPQLASHLNVMGQDLANTLLHKLPMAGERTVRLLGKESQSKNHEGDILLQAREKKQFVSLKFCKAGSYVNTKSGGVSSFLEKYFPSQEGRAWQEKLNTINELTFHELGNKLYARVDEKWHGQFDEKWFAAGGVTLPGELDEVAKEWLFHRYERILDVLKQAFFSLAKDKEIFEDGLKKLCGFSEQCDFQLWLNHYEREKRWETHTLTREELAVLLPKSDFLPAQGAKSSFTLSFRDYLLQIRIKPMNAFTTKSFKVNCSLKYIH